jgi:hypothetical protein
MALLTMEAKCGKEQGRKGLGEKMAYIDTYVGGKLDFQAKYCIYAQCTVTAYTRKFD